MTALNVSCVIAAGTSLSGKCVVANATRKVAGNQEHDGQLRA